MILQQKAAVPGLISMLPRQVWANAVEMERDERFDDQ
jgi:hypothetical protein